MDLSVKAHASRTLFPLADHELMLSWGTQCLDFLLRFLFLC